uniref:Uncharacterized protein n=1 Tax=Trichogramma kaykai TaxID=54128 RepID=A0ABD2X7X2_9HYME
MALYVAARAASEKTLSRGVSLELCLVVRYTNIAQFCRRHRCRRVTLSTVLPKSCLATRIRFYDTFTRASFFIVQPAVFGSSLGVYTKIHIAHQSSKIKLCGVRDPLALGLDVEYAKALAKFQMKMRIRQVERRQLFALHYR